MASRRCGGSSSHRTMISEKKKATTTTTILLSLMTMTVVGINDHVTCWPMIESPPPWSTPSPLLPPPPPQPTSTSASEELDSDASRKVLGSSVVTSVSVVMNNSDGKSNLSTTPAVEFTVAVSNFTLPTRSIVTSTATTAKVPILTNKLSSLDDDRRINNAELKSNAIASPGNFLNPDKYEFYTFDEAGDLVKRLMSWDEIQGLIAASDTDGLLGEAVVPIYYNENANANTYIAVADKLHGTHLTANEFQTSDVQDVHKVVESVQNVLKSELAAAASSQSKIIPAAVKPSSLHSNSPNWSSLFLPNFLENLDEDAFVDLQQHHHHHLSPDDTLTITSPIHYPSKFNKTNDHTVANITETITSSSPVLQTRTTPTTLAAPSVGIKDNISEKDAFNNVTLKNFATTPLSQKFTRIKNTAAKPTNIKHSSSTTSEKLWSLPNSLVSDEKLKNNFIIHSSSTSSPTLSSSPLITSTSSFLSSFSSSEPVKSHWSTKASPTSVATKTTVALRNENSTASHYEASVTTNRNPFTAALTSLLSPMNNNQQQTIKTRPNLESLVPESFPKTTTKHHYTNHLNQHNTTVTSNFNLVPLVDREKVNTSHYQSSSSSPRNSTEKYFGGALQMTTATSFPYTRHNGSTSYSAGNLATKTTDLYQHKHTNEDSTENSKSSSTSATFTQSLLLFKQSPTAEANSNTISWKINGINSSLIETDAAVKPTSSKFNVFTPYRNTTMAASIAESVPIHTALSTNSILGQNSTQLVKIGGESELTTTVEPLVTWISTNNFEDQRVENKISNNGQILDFDKLVTEQYVSGMAQTAAVTTNEQLVSLSKDVNRINSGGSSEQFVSSSLTNIVEPFTKKATVWSTIGDNYSKTNLHVDSKKHMTQTLATATTATTLAMSQQSPSSSYHTWMSATTSEPTPDLIQQQMVQTRINSGNVESKTTTMPNSSNNHHPYHNHHTNHHNQQQAQMQHVIPNRNSVATFSSYYHRERPSAIVGSSSTIADTNILKYTKNPTSTLINTTVANEMVMQRIPTLDPPNKVASTANGGIVIENLTNEKSTLIPPNPANIPWTTKSAIHSSTESVKNLTQIAIMVNKSNDTQVTMMKNSFNKNSAELKHKQTLKPSHFFDAPNSNNPNKKYNTNKNNSEEDKTQPTVKPLNVEFLNDCITSFISNSVVSGGSGGSGSNNDREHETLQSLSYNGTIGSTVNASHDNHHHYNLHRHHNHGDNEDDYHSTTTNYVSSVLSRDQIKYNSSSGASIAGPIFGATHATFANTWDIFQQKVALSSAATTTGEKQKENSHIYYYKLPPINSQPLKANANNTPAYSSTSTAGRNTYSSTFPTTSSWIAARPTSVSADKTYQKITTVNQPSFFSPSNLVTNDLADINRNAWKQNIAVSTVAISPITSLTNSQHSLHTEARISNSSSTIDKTSTIALQDMITLNSADASTTAELENREAAATTFHQIINTKSSQVNELQTTDVPTKHDYDMSSNNSVMQSMKLKSTTTNLNSASSKRTEPIATPQMITVTLNFSTTVDPTIQPTTPVAVGELTDLRKVYIPQYNDIDNVAVAITNDNDDDDDDDDDDEDDEDEDKDNNKTYSFKEQGVDSDTNEQVNHENDHRHKTEDILVTKNQRISNATTAQFWPIHIKTTLDELSSKDRTQNNITNKNFTASNQERLEIRATPSSSSIPFPPFNVVINGTTSRSGNINIVTTLASTTMTITYNNISTATSTTTTAPPTLSSTVISHNDAGFVRVKLENRTTQSLYDTITTSAVNNKQKDEKIKITLAKNQPSKQNSVTGTATTTATTNTTPSSITNSANIFRSPVPSSTLARPQLSQSFTASISNTASPITIATPTTMTWLTNGNGNAASAAVELHPAPHENMGLEASIAYLGDDVKTFIDLCNELSFKIWTTQTGKSLTTSRSIVLSPFALLSTLAMIFLGARGSSSGIMNDFLRLDDMVTFNPHQVFRNITESAVNSKNTGAANVAFVRQVFSDKTKGNVLEFYKERLQQYYDTYVEEINFNAIGDLVRRRTNLLVKRQTQGRIQDYLRGSAITMKPPLATFTANLFQTDCSIASTEGRDGEMYFVVRPSTRQRRLVPIPAVVYRGGFLAGYEPGLDATAVTLSPESIISTILVLPGQQGQVAPGDGLARLEQRLLESSYRRGAWSRLLRSLLFRHGLEVQIPRFSHKSILNLTMGLQRMGMGEIFTADKADLRGINGLLNELHLSDCIQANTFSTCGEESVGARHHVETFPSFAQRTGNGRQVNPKQASLTTTAPLNLRPRQARLPDNPRLRFDRPFLYIVRHNPTGMILYIGRFNPRLLP